MRIPWSPVGGGLHVRLDVVGDRLRRLRHRRVLPAPWRLEGLSLDDRPLVIDAVVDAYGRVIGSARRHGVPDDDIRHAVDHLAFMDDDADAEAGIDAVLALGPDRAGLPLELALVVGDDGDVVVVHAMRMRAKYAHLWSKSEGGRKP